MPPTQHWWSMVLSSHISSVLGEGAPPHRGTASQQPQWGGETGERHPKSRPYALLPVLSAPQAVAVGRPCDCWPVPGPARALSAAGPGSPERSPRAPHEPGRGRPAGPAPATAAALETAAVRARGRAGPAPVAALLPFVPRSSSAEPAAESPGPGSEGPRGSRPAAPAALRGWGRAAP